MMELFYREKGEGVPIIILHGLYGCSDNWMYIAGILSEEYRVIAVDCRNHGNSPHADTHTYPEMVDDLFTLFHELKIEKAHILGHSMGGKLAMAFSAVYPEKIVSLTVADIAPKNYLKSAASDTQYEMHKLILDSLSKLDLSKYTSRNEIQKEIGTTIPDKLIMGFVLKNLKRTPIGFEWKINIDVLRKNLDHILSGVDISDNYNMTPSKLYPVLFIRGGLSGYIQETDYFEIRRMYPNAEIVTIEGATHFLHTEKPDEFASIYLEFLKTVD